MRRIEFIAPVEAMRGNLSGAQNLAYAKNDNKAFDAPEGRQYARNYDPRYIGAKISATGKKIFAVKTKAATKINAASLLRMALLGGTGALYASLLKNENKYLHAEDVYGLYVSRRGETRTFRKFWNDQIRAFLSKKKVQISVSIVDEAGNLHQCQFKNPWVYTGGTPECPVSNEVLAKFWTQLASNPVIFTVGGAKGVAHSGDTFQTVIDGEYNVLGLEGYDGDAGETQVKLGEQYVAKLVDGDVKGIQLTENADGQFILTETPAPIGE